eukprot:8693867-Pyramimonas_sp.AAC.1
MAMITGDVGDDSCRRDDDASGDDGVFASVMKASRKQLWPSSPTAGVARGASACLVEAEGCARVATGPPPGPRTPPRGQQWARSGLVRVA